MEFLIRLLGGLVVTYVVSRIVMRLVGSSAKRSLLPLLAVHLLSFVAIAVPVGLIRAYWSSFNLEATIPYVIPQIVWLLLDLVRMRMR